MTGHRPYRELRGGPPREPSSLELLTELTSHLPPDTTWTAEGRRLFGELYRKLARDEE